MRNSEPDWYRLANGGNSAMEEFDHVAELERVATVVADNGLVAICGPDAAEVSGRLCTRLIPARPCSHLSELARINYPAVVIDVLLSWPYRASLKRIRRSVATATRFAIRMSGRAANLFSRDLLHDMFVRLGFRLHSCAHWFNSGVDDGYWVIMERVPLVAMSQDPLIVIEDARRGSLDNGLSALRRMDIVASLTAIGDRVFAYSSGGGDDVHALRFTAPTISILAAARSYEEIDYALTNYDDEAISYVPVARMSLSRVPENSSDMFLVSKGLSSLPDYVTMLSHAMRVLVPGGKLVVCVPPRLKDGGTGKGNKAPQRDIYDMLENMRELTPPAIIPAGRWSILAASRTAQPGSEVLERPVTLAAG